MQNDGGAAFPRPGTLGAEDLTAWATDQAGMSLRDWFAGQAVQAISNELAQWTKSREMPLTAQEMANVCYELADAMLAQRSKNAN